MRKVTRLAAILAAMGHTKRLLILELLSRQPAGLVVGDIRHAADLSGPALSHHLARLQKERLVEVNRQGTYLWYTLNRPAVNALEDQLKAALSGEWSLDENPRTPPEAGEAFEIEFD